MTGELPADLGSCRWCQCPQWRHRRGRGGCQEVGCGCAKYGQDPAEQERVLTVFAEVCEQQADQARSELAALVGDAPVLEVDPDSPVPGVADVRPDGPDLGVQVAGPEPAQPGDVDLEPTLFDLLYAHRVHGPVPTRLLTNTELTSARYDETAGTYRLGLR
ncbi:hypothetical protein ABZ847_29320, partial [Streptomyces bauhiniae]